MNWLFEPFRYEFMQRAIITCILIGFTNGFLGSFVVVRRLSLMADALSHSLLPGLAVAAILVGLSPGGLLLGGLLAAFLVILGAYFISCNSRIKEETAVATLYIIAFALGVTIIKYSGVRISLDHFLFGNILGVGDSDLWTIFAISCMTLFLLVALQRPLLLTIFESSIARTQGIRVDMLLGLLMILIVLVMVSSFQAVGVLLSFGLLILPAAVMYLLSNSYAVMSWGGAIIGVAGAVVGLFISFWANIPSGPAIILVLGLIFVSVYLFSPRYGIIVSKLHRRHLHEESLRRWRHKVD